MSPRLLFVFASFAVLQLATSPAQADEASATATLEAAGFNWVVRG
ncbi:hypothetical protein [Aeoliella straminimaris]|nr:hypothetical protein [Aeoliella straminimaris]